MATPLNAGRGERIYLGRPALDPFGAAVAARRRSNSFPTNLYGGRPARRPFWAAFAALMRSKSLQAIL